MSNDPFCAPENVATVEETAQQVANTKIELFGGWIIFSVFFVLSVAVLVLDTFGLPALMRLYPDIPMEFKNTCGGPGRAGGFALVFVVLIGFTMASLQVIAPRSVRFGFLFLILTAVLAQAFVAYGNQITAIMGEPPIAKYWESFFRCPDGFNSRTFATGVNLFYNPQGTTINNIGFDASVPRAFTDMLVANLGFLLLLAALSTLAAFVVSIIRFFRKSKAQDTALTSPRGIYGFFARSAVEQSILIQTAAWTGLAVVFGPILMMLIRESANATGPIQDLFWIGPVVFLFDLARVALWLPEPAAAVEMPKTDTTEVPPLILPQVLDGLKKLHGKQLPFDFSLTARTVATDIIAQNGSNFNADDIPNMGQGNLHFETLTSWHYELIIETLNRQVLDRGRTALFVCPVDVVENVRSALSEGFAKNPGINVVNWWCYGDPLPENDATELILVSPESLEALVEEIYNHTEFIGLLGGIFILNLHRMDLGLLHVSMKRLERHVDSAGDMVAILQSEYRREMLDWNKNFPLLNQISDFRMRRRPSVNESVHQHVALLRPASNEHFDAGRAQWPIGLRSLIFVAKNEHIALPYLFDVNIQHVQSFWGDHIINSLQNDDDAPTVAWAKSYRTPMLIPEEHAHPVALLADRNNLINVLGSEVGTPDALEALRLISTGGYPGAAFLLDEVKDKLGAARADTDRRDALDLLQRRLASIAPAPSGGPVELALMIRQEFKSATRARAGEIAHNEGFKTLSQERIEALWIESAALRQLHISNTKAGLEKLFRITLQPSAKGEMLTGKMTDQRSYEYTLTERATRDVNALATLELSITNLPPGATEVPSRTERVLLADYGLSYARGTRLTLGGRVYEVIEADALQRKLRVRYSEGRPAFAYTFVRDYAVLTQADDQSGFAADQLISRTANKVPHEVASGYLQVARRTRATYQNKNLLTPLDQSNSAPNRSAVDAESLLQIRSSAIIRLYGPKSSIRKAGNFPTRQKVSAGKQRNISGALAFTLATTLQDVLQMLFPANAHRIAVLSPQANLPAQQGTIDSFAFERQPSLRSLDQKTGTVASRSGSNEKAALGPKAVAEYMTLTTSFFDRARSVGKAPGHKLRPSLDLFIIEDSDHDLGVAKSLTREHVFTQILTFWRDFVAHSVDTAQDPDAAYTFGADKAAGFFDFEGALETLNEMMEREN